MTSYNITIIRQNVKKEEAELHENVRSARVALQHYGGSTKKHFL